MRTTSHLGQAIAASVGVALLISAVVACSHHGTDHDGPVVTGPATGTGHRAASVARAYQFLNLMMDRHTGGTTPRLVQSYLGGLLGLDGDTSSAIYDDALVIDAYLAEGTPQWSRPGRGHRQWAALPAGPRPVARRAHHGPVSADRPGTPG